jgi:RNA-directed DNA polymerase
MNEFDQFVKHKLKAEYYIRYADDFAVVSHDRAYLEQILPLMQDFLRDKLKLSMHPNKVSIRTVASGVDFLGWVHFSDHRVLRTATKRRMFSRIEVSGHKDETIASYVGMLQHGNGWKLRQKIIPKIDKVMI